MTGKRVVHTDARWWDVPYCSDCLRHARIRRQASLLGGAAVTFYVLAGGMVAILASQATARREIIGQFAVAAFCFLAMAILCSVGWKRINERVRRQMKATCTTAGAAVAYLGWCGTVHAFRFSNPSYAHAFIAGNRGKVLG